MTATTCGFELSMTGIFNVGTGGTSDNVGRVISETGIGMAEKIGFEVGIAAPSFTVENVFTNLI